MFAFWRTCLTVRGPRARLGLAIAPALSSLGSLPSAERLKWVKLSRIGLAAAPPVNLRQRKCLQTARNSR